MKQEPDWQTRVNAALVIALIEMASIVTLNHTPRDDSYYLVCMPFNMFIVMGLPYVSKSLLISDLQILNVCAIVWQLIGFFIYWFEWPVQIYNGAIHLITLLQILRLLLKRKGDANGLAENNSRLSVVRHYYLYCYKKLYPEAKT